jgi:hypothetical protein
MSHKTIEHLVYIVVWGGLVCAWNLGYPGAKPWMDIAASVAILFITRFSLRWAQGLFGSPKRS